MKIILGSASPRRKEILNFFSLPFEQKEPLFDENSFSKEKDPKKFASLIAQNKAKSLVEKFPNRIILSADTIVFCEGKIYIKPKTEKDAYEMLSALSGSWHSVFTGVCVCKDSQLFVQVEETKILFHPLSKKLIETYHKHFYFKDKAGGYAIQKAGSIIVKRIEGCYYNIMGLPLNATKDMLALVGINLWDYLKPL